MTTRDVGNQLAPFFKAHGFKRKSNRFFKIINNVAFCIELDRPGGLYVQSYIIPLYKPYDFRMFTYGNRLQDFEKCPVPNENWLTERTECNEYVEKTLECCEKYILPFYDRISTPQGLLDFPDEDLKSIHEYFFTGPMQILELKLYTNCLLSRFDAVLEDIPKLFAEYEIHRRRYIDEYKGRIITLKSMINASEEDRLRFINDTIEHSISACKFK
jgi:hypothetical protein